MSCATATDKGCPKSRNRPSDVFNRFEYRRFIRKVNLARCQGIFTTKYSIVSTKLFLYQYMSNLTKFLLSNLNRFSERGDGLMLSSTRSRFWCPIVSKLLYMNFNLSLFVGTSLHMQSLFVQRDGLLQMRQIFLCKSQSASDVEISRTVIEG